MECVKPDLLSMTPEELTQLCLAWGEPAYRGTQLFSFLCRGTPPGEMTALPKPLRGRLETEALFALPTVERKLTSAMDGTVKYLFRLWDGACIESVFMRYEHGNTLCISSEVGCPMGCRFCASTLGGKVRNLFPGEMLGQVIAAQKDMGERVSNIVMMGIGEPLDNYDNTVRFLHLVNRADGLNIGYRHISLSTCGVVPGMERLAAEKLPITLSVSLHAATDEVRSALMPVNRKWNIARLMQACVDYYRATGRRISFEYTLISGKNDREEDARQLAGLLKGTLGRAGAPLHVNLIRVNEVKERAYKRPGTETANRFAALLGKYGVNATVRRRLGADVDAACGQLRRRAAEEAAQAAGKDRAQPCTATE